MSMLLALGCLALLTAGYAALGFAAGRLAAGISRRPKFWLPLSLAICLLLETAYYLVLVLLAAMRPLVGDATYLERFSSWLPDPWFALFPLVGLPAWLLACVLQMPRFRLR